MTRVTSNTVVGLDGSPELIRETIIQVGANGGTAVLQTDKNIYVTDVNEQVINQRVVQTYSNLAQTVNNNVNTPAGVTNGQIQYYDSGNLGASIALRFYEANSLLSVDGNIASNNITTTQGVYSLLVSSNSITSTLTMTANNFTANSATVNNDAVITGNITANNVSVGNNVTVTGNITSGNIDGGNLSKATYLEGTLTTLSNSQPNVTSVANVLSAGNITLYGNTGTSAIRAADNQPINIGTYDTISANYHYIQIKSDGNVVLPTADTANTILRSSTNIIIQSALANYILDQYGNANLANTIIANYAQATLTTAANTQPNIAVVGNLSYLNLTTANGGNGNLTAVNIDGGNLVKANNANITDTANIVLANVGNLFVTANANIAMINANNANITGNVIIDGNLFVNGSTQYINVEELTVEDPIITLGAGANGGAPATNNKDLGTVLVSNPAGTVINRFMGWDTSNSEFALGETVTVSSEVVTFAALANLRANTVIANVVGNLAGNLVNGSSNVSVATNGNVSVGVTGVANVLLLSSTGANITGVANITGNLTAANVSAGNLLTANYVNVSQNVTVTANVSSNNLSVTANAVAGNLSVGGWANITGDVTVLANVNAANANLGNLLTANFANFSNNVVVTGNVTAGNLEAGNLLTANYANFDNNIFVGNGNITTTAAGVVRLSKLADYNNINGNLVFDSTNSNIIFNAYGNPGTLTVIGSGTIGISVAGTTATTVLAVTGNATAGNIEAGNLLTANYANFDNNIVVTGNATAANVIVGVVVKHTVTTVSSLPAAATVGAGARSFVSDANTTTWGAQVGSGGSNNIPVYSDGTNWRVG